MPILTIDSARLNGTPSAGTVRITASRSPLMDSGNNTVYSGTQTFPLDAQGKLSVSLPATDSPSIGPFTYTVEANLASGQWIYRGVKLPANVATIDITDAQSASQKMYPTRQEWDAITAGKVNGQGMTLRRDTTVGTRVFLDHPGGTTMLMGDTGWRNIAIFPAENFTGTTRLRRVGERVTLNIEGTITPPASGNIVGTTGAFLTVSPTGNGTSVQITHYNAKTVLATAHINPSGTLFLFAPTAGSVRQEISWITDKSWPTVPFGTP